MPTQTLTLKAIDGHPKVDNNCFFTFLSDKGDVFLSFKSESKGRDGRGIPKPPVSTEFGTFRCRVHQLVVPPMMRRIPSVLSPNSEASHFGKELVVSEGKSQLVQVITDFEEIRPVKGSYAHLYAEKQLQNDDWSIDHHHHRQVPEIPTPQVYSFGNDMHVKGRANGTCPIALTPYGRSEDVIMLEWAYEDFKEKYPSKTLPSWLEYSLKEEHMHTILMQLSSDDLVYAYHPISSEIDRRQFSKHFNNPKGVVFGMPPCKPIDALDILFIDSQEFGGVTRTTA